MLQTVFVALFLLTAVVLSLLVLIQRGRGGGLAGAFGGAGGSSAFGTKTADIFIKATAVLGGLFFLLAIITAFVMRGEGPAAPAAAVPPPEEPAPTAPAAPLPPVPPPAGQ
ncbi:MAG: preprotein translocase subunit SecG [Planctomycetes bacterium]|nr:preprotein translocase subunit SecG [Planctomycetota bacterium]